MTQLILTGLGNEVDLKTGRTIFTAVFNDNVRIEISKEAAQTLTSNIFGGGSGGTVVVKTKSSGDYERPPVQEEASSGDEGEVFGGNGVILEDTPDSVYDEDTGVEQV